LEKLIISLQRQNEDHFTVGVPTLLNFAIGIKCDGTPPEISYKLDWKNEVWFYGGKIQQKMAFSPIDSEMLKNDLLKESNFIGSIAFQVVPTRAGYLKLPELQFIQTMSDGNSNPVDSSLVEFSGYQRLVQVFPFGHSILYPEA
jgi:hypothetical protein